MLSNEQYLDKDGLVCPCCGGDNLEFGETETDIRAAWQKVYCNDCDASWHDIYMQTGYELIQAGSESDEQTG